MNSRRRKDRYAPIVLDLPPGATWTSTKRVTVCPRPGILTVWRLNLSSGDSCVYDTTTGRFTDPTFRVELEHSSKVTV